MLFCLVTVVLLGIVEPISVLALGIATVNEYGTVTRQSYGVCRRNAMTVEKPSPGETDIGTALASSNNFIAGQDAIVCT